MSSSDRDGTPRALILAAGIGKRLQHADGGPKCLLEFGGRSLLARHLALLHRHGVAEVAVVVGHQAAAVRAALGGAAATILNPDYRRGSVISLAAGKEVLTSGAPVVLMDADVLYDARLMARLVAPGAPCRVLVDRELEPGDEPVKLCLRAGRIVDFHKRPVAPHDWHGESVGFFWLDAVGAADLAARADAYVQGGRGEMEYEEPLRDLMLAAPDRFGVVDVTGLPWSEIDFAEDVVKAQGLLAEMAP